MHGTLHVRSGPTAYATVTLGVSMVCGEGEAPWAGHRMHDRAWQRPLSAQAIRLGGILQIPTRRPYVLYGMWRGAMAASMGWGGSRYETQR